jgi:CRISPR/Cas system CSM-associated protein Csm4 (group 5 of RAMP superfamily)
MSPADMVPLAAGFLKLPPYHPIFLSCFLPGNDLPGNNRRRFSLASGQGYHQPVAGWRKKKGKRK